ncbi:hypothetical protein TYRP_015152 [Tyrophagus putrescentiae]|nr:hypothetical protein TYRP_015152 [Tyrophagus putrescentiae]
MVMVTGVPNEEEEEGVFSTSLKERHSTVALKEVPPVYRYTTGAVWAFSSGMTSVRFTYQIPHLIHSDQLESLDGGVGIDGSRVLQRHLYRAVQEDVGSLDGGVEEITYQLERVKHFAQLQLNALFICLLVDLINDGQNFGDDVILHGSVFQVSLLIAASIVCFQHFVQLVVPAEAFGVALVAHLWQDLLYTTGHHLQVLLIVQVNWSQLPVITEPRTTLLFRFTPSPGLLLGGGKKHVDHAGDGKDGR